ncbi:Aldo/keto reductase [Flagelloscypha sp. PMI_526]|nr:Aldo/keto reductase [Flagelloscypha sp. PMI_526]
MQYVRLGNSGLQVSKIILGCMSYGSPEWQPWVLGEKEGIEHVKFAYENGINTFDTANVYSNGHSEIVLGKAIKTLNLPREDIVVLTKHIFASIKASLSRLQLEYVDLLQSLHDVVQAGYVRYIGMSSCNAYHSYLIPIPVHIMQNYAITHNLTPFISMQNHYNLIYHFGVGSIPWSPLGRGYLTRPLDEKTKRSGTDRFYGRYENVSMAQIALAWIMAKEGVTAPIVGTTSTDNLRISLLDAEEIKSLEEPYVAQALIGHT